MNVPGRSARYAWLFALGLCATAQAERDSFEQRMQPCAVCHGEQGRATEDGYYPRIAGKPAGYLYEQLLNFREGQRLHAQMTYLVERQRDDYLRQMAAHFAAIELPYPAALPARVAASVLARGETLVRQGVPARGVPACTSCHGAALTGIEPAVPGLLGLPYDYLAAQLGAWQQGVRHARAPDCMAQIAQVLTPADIEAVAAWLAAQTVPVNARAVVEPIASQLECGSWIPRP